MGRGRKEYERLVGHTRGHSVKKLFNVNGPDDYFHLPDAPPMEGGSIYPMIDKWGNNQPTNQSELRQWMKERKAKDDAAVLDHDNQYASEQKQRDQQLADQSNSLEHKQDVARQNAQGTNKKTLAAAQLQADNAAKWNAIKPGSDRPQALEAWSILKARPYNAENRGIFDQIYDQEDDILHPNQWHDFKQGFKKGFTGVLDGVGQPILKVLGAVGIPNASLASAGLSALTAAVNS